MNITIHRGKQIGGCNGFQKERDIQNWLTTQLKGKNHKPPFYFALCSSTDVERMASLFAACNTTNTLFICDRHQKNLLDIFTEYLGNHAALFDFSGKRCRYFKRNQYNYDLMQRHGFVMPIRASHIALVKELQARFPEAELIYSMWNGYYKGVKNVRNPKIEEMVHLFHESRVHATRNNFASTLPRDLNNSIR